MENQRDMANAVVQWKDESFLLSVAPLHRPVLDCICLRMQVWMDGGAGGSHGHVHGIRSVVASVEASTYVLELRAVQMALCTFAPQTRTTQCF